VSLTTRLIFFSKAYEIYGSDQPMRLGDIQPKNGSQQRPRRIGRGISAGQGASGGFGMRGQKSRSGRPPRPGFEGGQNPLYRRVPKLKWFPVINRKVYTIINVEKLADLPAKTEVTLQSLMDAGIVTTNDGPLKILGTGELKVALQVKAAAATKSAIAKIEGAGGSIEILNA
jgi:large subunit ribosomal protein L15